MHALHVITGYVIGRYTYICDWCWKFTICIASQRRRILFCVLQAIGYCRVSRYGYCVSCAMCIAVHRCTGVSSRHYYVCTLTSSTDGKTKRTVLLWNVVPLTDVIISYHIYRKQITFFEHLNT